MDFKPIPPSGQVQDLRKDKPKTEEEVKQEKQERNDKVRRNLRILALGLAAYYFVSAGYAWYQESKLENTAASAYVNEQNPLKDPALFRSTFNNLLNQQDTSLPTANAFDSDAGFVAVLSPALELQGFFKADSKEMQKVQIQTRYPDAFPPESVTAFITFVHSVELSADPMATQAQAEEILNALSIVPKVDANLDNKVFPQAQFISSHYVYETSFTSGPIDELTLVATPRANLNTENLNNEANSETAKDAVVQETIQESAQKEEPTEKSATSAQDK